ncbi:MAG TPA: hypothetical protein VIF11_16855 [Methylomirabilota bacterium]
MNQKRVRASSASVPLTSPSDHGMTSDEHLRGACRAFCRAGVARVAECSMPVT